MGSELGQAFLENRAEFFKDFIHYASENLKGMSNLQRDLVYECSDDGNEAPNPGQTKERYEYDPSSQVPQTDFTDEIHKSGGTRRTTGNHQVSNKHKNKLQYSHPCENESRDKKHISVASQGHIALPESTNFAREENTVIRVQDLENKAISVEDIMRYVVNMKEVKDNPVNADIEVLYIDSGYHPSNKFGREIEEKLDTDVEFNNKVEIIMLTNDNDPESVMRYPFVCDKCGQRFEFEHSLVAHKNLVLSCIDETFVKCDAMDREIISYKDEHGTLKVMTASTALRILKHDCLLCKYTNKRPGNVKRHFFVAHCKSKPFKCKYCDKCFKMEHYLNRHLLKAHHNSEYQAYKCKDCGKESASEKSLKYHQLFKCTERVKKVICDICNYTAISNTQLKQHMSLHSGDKPVKCPICEKRFMSEKSLRPHLDLHSEKSGYDCLECGIKFQTKRQKYLHSRTHSAVQQRYQCNQCNKTFGHQTALKYHTYTHSDAKPFVCELCGKGFIRKARLLVHIQLHNGAADFKCQICSKSFKTHDALKTHSVIHNKKTYTCEQCGKSFHRRGQLTQHYKRHTDTHTDVQNPT